MPIKIKIQALLLLTVLYVLVGISCTQRTLPREPDTIPPVATIIYPVDGMTVSGIVQVRISATDNDKVKHVEYFVNNTIQDTIKTSPFTFIWNTIQVEDDAKYYLSAKVQDRSDNYYQTEPIEIIVNNVDNQSPLGEILYPAPSLTVSGTIQILAYPYDNDAVKAEFLIDDELRFTDDSLEVVQPWNVNVYHYEWDTYDVTDNQTHNITVVLSDTAQNANALSSWVYVNNQVDMIPPVGNITNPAAGQTVHGITEIQITATDNDGIFAVHCYIDGDSLTTDYEEPYHISWSTVEYEEDAEHMIYVTIEDFAGNIASAPPITVFINNDPDLDVTPPTGTIISPTAGQSLSGVYLIEVIAYDDVEVSHVEFLINGYGVYADYSFPYSFEWDTETMPEDQEAIIGASVYDTGGNWAPAQPISVHINNQDNIYPEGVITTPYSGQTVSGLVDIQILATDNEAVQKVEFYIDGALNSTDYESPYEYTWDTEGEAEDENHSITVIIEDTNGNRTTLPPISVVVNNLPETDTTPPVVRVINPVSGQTVSGTVEIQIDASDNVEVESVTVTIDGTEVVTDSESPYSFSWDTTVLDNQSQHTVSAIAVDVNGNSALAQPVLVTIDNE